MFRVFAQLLKARFRIKENICIEHTDEYGNNKLIFNEYWWSKLIRRIINIKPFGFYDTKLKISNLVTSAGVAGIASRLNGAGSAAAFTYIAIGTGTTAAVVGDAVLQTEVSRTLATCTRVTTEVANDTAKLVAAFSFTSTLAITESGVLNAASTGTLLSRQTFSAINVVSGDQIQVTWTYDIDSGSI